MSERTPYKPDRLLELSMRAGMATALELIRTHGIEVATDAIDTTVERLALSDAQMAILADAVFQIAGAHHDSAPDDLSTLPAFEMEGCSDTSCDICWGAAL